MNSYVFTAEMKTFETEECVLDLRNGKLKDPATGRANLALSQ